MSKRSAKTVRHTMGGIAYLTAERVIQEGFYEDRPLDKGNGDPARIRFYFQRSGHSDPVLYVDVWVETDTGDVRVHASDQLLIAPLVSNGVSFTIPRR